MSNAIDGTNVGQCRSFEPTYTASSTAEAAIGPGSYFVTATTDAVLKIGVTGMGAAAALPTTQPAAGSPNQEIRLYAGIGFPLDIDFDAAFFRVIGVTAAGAISFVGPLGRSSNT